LDLNSQFIVTNLKHSKLLLKILVTHNMKNVISLKVRILGSNLFLTREYFLLYTTLFLITLYFVTPPNFENVVKNVPDKNFVVEL
jgi:hypothetical protein